METGITNIEFEEKYDIHYFNNKRYYKYDLLSEIIVLQDTIPYCFEYKGKKIYETAWNRLTVKILEMLDEINPLPNEKLLSLEYSWSKVLVFSSEKRTNFSKFKDIYVNTNHTSTHAGMSIKFLLETYGIDSGECIFYIRRHPSAEPSEAREYYRKQTEDAFRLCLEFKVKSQKSIDIIIGNFTMINKFLSQGSTGFNDFFLFDDYWYFTNYKIKTMDFVQTRYYGTKTYSATKTCLNHLDDFYKHRDFYLRIDRLNVTDELKDILCEEIEFLFKNLKTNIISISKLYARMTLLHVEMMEELNEINNLPDFSTLVEVILPDTYVFQKPFITYDRDATLENDDIILNYAFSLGEFNSKTISDYVNKMHLKRLSSYVTFMELSSDYYVQVDADRMISKENLKIEEYDISKINKALSYFINSFGPIDTTKYSDYGSLPALEYNWNKYLLVGVTRTFLGDSFIVESTGGSYKTVEYLIKIK